MKTITAILAGTIIMMSLSCKNKKTEKETKNVAAKPNVLLIVADDLGEEVGAYGDPDAHTPNLDKFAAEGVQFTNAYVTQASCSPSRSSMLTGLFPHQNGQVGLSHLGISMNKKYANLFSILKKEGYYNGIIGKLHVEPHEAFPYDYGIGGFDLRHAVKVSEKQKMATVEETDGAIDKIPEKFTRYNMPVVADTARAFISRRGDKPFFLMMNLLDPHRPFRNQINGYPKDELTKNDVKIPAYCGSNDPELLVDVTGYYNGAARFDEGVGLVMKMLEDKNLLDNTLIIVLGDHGPPLPRAKTTSYEAGLRIPMMVHFPGGKYKGKQNAFVSTIDILPTVLDVIGSDALPKKLPGMSWVDLMEGNVKKRKYIAGEYTQHVPTQLFPQRAITDGDFKLIHNPLVQVYKKNFRKDSNWKWDYEKSHDLESYYETYSRTPEYQLFDLKRDPHEFNNLAYKKEYAQELDHMKKALHNWQKSTQDPLLDRSYQNSMADQIKKYIVEERKKK